MPGGGGKGPSSSGNITQTTVNPTQQAQLPFLVGSRDNAGGGWNRAAYLADSMPIQYYPGKTRADDNFNLPNGYQTLIDTGYGLGSSVQAPANAAFNSAVNGGYGVQNSPAFSGYSDIAGGNSPGQIAALGAAQTLPQLGQYAKDTGLAFGKQFASMYGGAGVGGNVNALAGFGDLAATNPYAGKLNAMSDGRINGAPQAYGLLGSAGAAAGSPNLATRSLGATARGDFLNKNPYIDAQYDAASRPLTRAYMTATAPQTDSNYEMAGRYGSGVLGGARSQNEQNLGKSLGDLGANLYGQDYANERGLQTSAAGTLGSLINQGLGVRTAAGSALGNLGLGEFNSRTGAMNQAGNQFLGGLQTGIGAHSAAGNLQESDYNSRLAATRAAYDAVMGGSDRATSAYTNAGNLGLGYAGSQLPALNGLQSGYQAGNSQALQGLALEPSVTAGNLAPGQAMIQGGQGLTGLSQQQIDDQMKRFYGEQNAPWQTAQNYMNLVGQPTAGSKIETTPVLGPSALSSGLGAIGGLNSAFGSNGFASGLFGGGGGGAGLLGADNLTGINALPLSVSGIPESEAVMGALGGDFGGGGLASALPFAATVICTELRRQDRMPLRHYVAAARADVKIPQIVRAGYHAWAIPSVRHLRRKPHSLYSRLLAKTFNWRAEDLAARAGVKGARLLWRGRMVTAALALPCLALGLLCRKADLAGLYDAHKAPL